jgi:hypothetical protein
MRALVLALLCLSCGSVSMGVATNDASDPGHDDVAPSEAPSEVAQEARSETTSQIDCSTVRRDDPDLQVQFVSAGPVGGSNPACMSPSTDCRDATSIVSAKPTDPPGGCILILSGSTSQGTCDYFVQCAALKPPK